MNQKIREELDDLIKQLAELELELSTLEKISKFTESIGTKLIRLYAEVFPKKCNNCGMVFKTRNDYLKATFPLRNTGTVYNDEQVQEYRNCVCGSTLLIVTNERRDTSDFGIARRKLFDVCVEKMMAISGKNKEEVTEIVRKVFRIIIKNSQIIESLEDKKINSYRPKTSLH